MTASDVTSSKRHNVLFLAQIVNCNDGITTYCQTLAAGLRNRGVNVFLASGDVRFDEKSLKKKLQLEAIVSQWLTFPGLKRLPSVTTIMKLRKLIKDNDIKAINVHGLGMLFLGRILSIMTGTRLVATYHPSVSGDLENAVKSATSKFSFTQNSYLNLFFPDTLIVLSEESVQFMGRNKIWHKDRMVKLFGGTDLSHFYPPSADERAAVRKEYGLEQDDLAIVLAARLSWVKGHDLLIKAVRKLRLAHPEIKIKCLFVGSGGKDREAEITSFAYSGGGTDKDTFRFLGFMSDVRPALWAADIFALPSRFEGFPLGVAEAMSTGLVAIRTPSGGASDQIIDGETGFIVPFEDVDALADAILKLADAQVRTNMATKSMERARTYFGVKPMVDGILPMYGLPVD